MSEHNVTRSGNDNSDHTGAHPQFFTGTRMGRAGGGGGAVADPVAIHNLYFILKFFYKIHVVIIDVT
jgi:hypothetical protein